MKIDFTKDEYKLLLEALYLSDWVVHSQAIKPEDYHPAHQLLKNKILSHYNEMEAGDIVEPVEEGSNEFYETAEFEQAIHKQFIDPYEEGVFWEELIHRLAERDVIKKFGMQKYLKMDGNERVNSVDEIRKKYDEEFSENNLENLQVIRKVKPKKKS